ncbi:glycosyltransferase family 4 protein [Octadecabacter sp. 1_MG-2023]|uniref:glycosyltransferase family 4 protein n=1 Tax=unclassified Octadecabacter TaxID=196158 RepID=UPI001C08C98F|nr:MULTISPECIES: glycosyltransferase family 4 protein [unclassified Octadecabacter]MBU2994495.1 glycosyltransferase family 4 protein [Octadecabacter sp. B2R22]MDO6734212.1 glycosyltransferase family 4 protein [Octadecabacter sp. 1_MG-2023]
MTLKPQILHLIDDTTAGGVTRVVDFICTSDALNRTGNHMIHKAQRGRFGTLPKAVDVIVSHTTISWRTLPALIALRASRPNTPIIHVEHSYTSAFVSLNVTRRGRFASLLKVAFSLFDRVVAVSHAQADWMTSRNIIEEQKLTTIQSCVDLKPLQSIPRIEGHITTLGAIGRLDRQKGFDLLIDAFKTLPNPSLRLKVIGTGPQEEMLRKLAGADERIEFVGFCADPNDAFRVIDAVVMPSRWEAFGLVAIETLASGRPLLCAKVDGLMDHEEHGTQYFGSFTRGSLASAIEDLLRTSCTADKPPATYRANRAMETFQDAWLQLIAAASNSKDVELAAVAEYPA